MFVLLWTVLDPTENDMQYQSYGEDRSPDVPAFGDGSIVVHEQELLADELRRLVGWGVEPNRLALKPVLRHLAEVQPSLPRLTAGCIIRRYLEGVISSLDGVYKFQGQKYEARTMNRVYRLLLGFEGGNLTAVARRYRVMEILGVDYSYDQWRKSYHLERALLLILAEELIRKPNLQN